MTEAEDVSSSVGWLVRLITPGSTPAVPAVARYFHAYEPDELRAIELVKAYVQVAPGETYDTVRRLNIDTFTAEGMNPGDVKQYDRTALGDRRHRGRN
jgi:hypothetical protein